MNLNNNNAPRPRPKRRPDMTSHGQTQDIQNQTPQQQIRQPQQLQNQQPQQAWQPQQQAQQPPQQQQHIQRPPQNVQPRQQSAQSYQQNRNVQRKMKRPPRPQRSFTSYILRAFLFIIMLVIAVVGISWGFSKLSRLKNGSDTNKTPSTDSMIESQPTENPLISETERDTSAESETAATGETSAAEVSLPADTEYNYEFASDLSAYEEYMEPADRDAYVTLINVDNPLDSSYIPDDLTDVADTRADGRSTQQMRLYAEKALEAMLIEARANGFDDVTVTSGYRSYEYQTQLFDARVDQYSYLGDDEARAMAATIVAIPGTSEHQSGLCADMHNLPSADVSFAQTDAAKWLDENCYKFGFILRFPEDKTEITGISFEPWHFRYVGRYHASRMHESGLCLEEYAALLGSDN